MIRKEPTLLLARRIERFLRRSGMSAARFGRTVVRDPRFVFDLRRGREVRLPTERRVAAWLDAQEGQYPCRR